VNIELDRQVFWVFSIKFDENLLSSPRIVTCIWIQQFNRLATL